MDQVGPLSPTLHYIADDGYFSSLRPSIVNSIVKKIIDIDIWKGSGIAMKGRREFAENCHLIAPEYCKVENRKSIIKKALEWASNDNGFLAPLKEKWKDKLETQVAISGSLDCCSASEFIFNLFDDDGFTSSIVSSQLKQKMALCLMYAIWKEKEEIKELDNDQSIEIFLKGRRPYTTEDFHQQIP